MLLDEKVAVCVPVVAELLMMIAELPGAVPFKRSAADPSRPGVSVSEIPDPPATGARTVSSPVDAMWSPTDVCTEVPTVAKVE